MRIITQEPKTRKLFHRSSGLVNLQRTRMTYYAYTLSFQYILLNHLISVLYHIIKVIMMIFLPLCHHHFKIKSNERYVKFYYNLSRNFWTDNPNYKHISIILSGTKGKATFIYNYIFTFLCIKTQYDEKQINTIPLFITCVYIIMYSSSCPKWHDSRQFNINSKIFLSLPVLNKIVEFL